MTERQPPTNLSERIYFDDRLREFKRVVDWLVDHAAADPNDRAVFEPGSLEQHARQYAFAKYDQAYP